MAIPNSDNYTLGRGKLSFNQYDANGALTFERDLGNAPNVALSINIEFLDHFSSRSGFRSKDKTAVLEVAPTIAFSLDEMAKENWQLFVYGASSEITQTAGDFTFAIASPVVDRIYDLGKKRVGSFRITHGTVTGGPFQRGETITGGTSAATAVVQQVGSSSLLVNTISGTFVTAETITGGTSFASASTTSAAVFQVGKVTVVRDSDSAVFVQDTDFTCDGNAGIIYTMPTGSIDTTAHTVEFSGEQTIYTQINGLADTSLEGQLRFRSDNPEGPNLELLAWKVKLQPDGDTAFIGDDWAQMSFNGEILKDEAGHPAEPYMVLNFIT